MRSQWQQRAPAEQQGQDVSQLAVHSIADDRARCMETCVKERVQWRSHCRSPGDLRMSLAASGRRLVFRFRWPNLITVVPLGLQYMKVSNALNT